MGTASRHAPWSLREAVDDLRSGRARAGDLVETSLARISTTESDVHAWVAFDRPNIVPYSFDGTVLQGVPIGVKDIIDVAGYPTKCGSVTRSAAEIAGGDAVVVAAWRQAGAVPIGKTVTTEFAYFAPGPTRNPAHLGHTPGGSSSGSAAAVAAGHVPLALGSQTAGSVTRPAAYCGVASLVMSRGRFPTDGVVGLSPSFDSHGVFAATASDLALAWSALTGSEDVGPYPEPAPKLLLWSPRDAGSPLPPMRHALAQAVRRLMEAGAVIDSLPDTRLVADLISAHLVVMAAEAAVERSAELADTGRLSVQLADLLVRGAATEPERFHAAMRTIERCRSRLSEMVQGYDAVLGPAALGPAPEGIDATGDPILSRPWQALGLPVVTVPALRDPAGLPLGLQIVGRSGDEVGVLRAAAWTEATLRATAR